MRVLPIQVWVPKWRISCQSSKMNLLPNALWHTSVANWYSTATLSIDRILLYHLSAMPPQSSLFFWGQNMHLILNWCFWFLNKWLNDPNCNMVRCVSLLNCELTLALSPPTLFSWGNKICLLSHLMVRSQNWVSPRGEISNSIWLGLSSESGQSLDARNVQKCLKRCYIDYEIQLWILLPSGGKNRKHKSKSFVPDVRTERHGYLISIRDMCFECETLVSLPRWALCLICAIYVRLSYACSSQMGPRWSSIFLPRRNWGVCWIPLF